MIAWTSIVKYAASCQTHEQPVGEFLGGENNSEETVHLSFGTCSAFALARAFLPRKLTTDRDDAQHAAVTMDILDFRWFQELQVSRMPSHQTLRIGVDVLVQPVSENAETLIAIVSQDLGVEDTRRLRVKLR